LFGPLGVLVEALLPTGDRRPQSVGPNGARPTSPAPHKIRPRKAIQPDDEDITQPEDRVGGWQVFRRSTTGEVFCSPAPEPEPEASDTAKPRWERALKQVDDKEG
jgi:hypothetical protein